MDTYSSAQPFTSTATLPGLQEWEHLMRQAVDATRFGNAATAERLYREALFIAEAVLDDAACECPTHAGACADDRVAAFVVTHLNLSELLVDADCAAEAIAGLCTAHRRLMALLRHPNTSPAMQLAACRHSRETHAALLSHLTGPDNHPAIVAALQAGCMPFPVRNAAPATLQTTVLAGGTVH